MTRYLTGPGSEDPFALHAELQATMQSNVGIFRHRDGLSTAVDSLDWFVERARRACARPPAELPTTRAGTRAGTSGTCSPSPRPSRAPRSCARRAAARTAGSTSRSTTRSGRGTTSSSGEDGDGDARRAAAGRHEVRSRAARRRAEGRRSKHEHAHVPHLARRLRRRQVRRVRARGPARHGRPRRRARDPALDRAGPRRALELQGGEVRIVQRGDQRAPAHSCARPRSTSCPRSAPITVEPLRAFPIIRDLVTDVSWNYEVNKRIPPFTPKPDTEWLIGQEDVDRMAEFRKCIECFLCQDVCHVLRDHELQSQYFGPRFMVRVASLEMHPLDAARPDAPPRGRRRRRALQHHEVLRRRLPRAHQDHRQRDHPAQGARGRQPLRPGPEARAVVHEAPAAAHPIGSPSRWRPVTTSWWSALGWPGCGPRSRPSGSVPTSPSSRRCIRCAATPARPRAASTQRSGTRRRTARRSTPTTR